MSDIMERKQTVEMFLTLLSGIGWMLVYEECIRLGFRDKTYCMPLWALALNLAWESLYSITEVTGGAFSVQTVVNILWCGLDVFILVTYVRYGRKEFGEHGKGSFALWTILAFATAYALQIVFMVQFPEGLDSACWSAFLQNLLMSILFITQIERRKSTLGTSLTLAVAKWIGTLAPTITLGFMAGRPLVIVAGMACTVFDLIYIALVAKYRKETKRA